MTAAVDADMQATRDRLVAALYQQPALRKSLTMAEITAAVDVALSETGVRVLVEAAVAGQAAVEALASEVPSPSPATAAAVASWDTRRGLVADRYGAVEP